MPRALREQLQVGGRLVIPVSVDGAAQKLLLIRRTAAGRFEEEDYGEVAFVPLVGEQGWRDGGRELPSDGPEPPCVALARPMRRIGPGNREPAALIAAAAEPLPEVAEPDFRRLADRFGDARVVLMGEATHGTSEFYRARAELTKRLILEHGFTVIAVEADWPDAARIDRYARGRTDGMTGVAAFTRFPAWMWRNVEVRALIDWLRAYNETMPRPSIESASMASTSIVSTPPLPGCWSISTDTTPRRRGWARDVTAVSRPGSTTLPVTDGRTSPAFRDLPAGRCSHAARPSEGRVERTRRGMARASRTPLRMRGWWPRRSATTAPCTTAAAESWNLRDRHMFETLQAVLFAWRGALDTKAVVWAHILTSATPGATEMGKNGGTS